MNIIEELVKKHQGEYSQEFEKSSNMISGHYTYQPQQGIVIIDGTKISINIKAVGGASRTAEPYRIVLHLGENYESRLEIFPKTNLKRFIEFFTSSKNPTNSIIVNKQFCFSGDKGLITKLGIDYSFCNMIQDENAYILIGKKYPNHIVLTPSYGINSIEHFEKLLSILKLIEGKIKGYNK